jgi:thioredoxin 1
MLSLNKETFDEKVVKAEKLVVVDFGATWCGPCKKLKPILEEMSESLTEKAEFYYVDAGEQPDLAREQGVMSLPTILFYKSGDIKDRLVGLVSKDKILEKIDALN